MVYILFKIWMNGLISGGGASAFTVKKGWPYKNSIVNTNHFWLAGPSTNQRPSKCLFWFGIANWMECQCGRAYNIPLPGSISDLRQATDGGGGKCYYLRLKSGRVAASGRATRVGFLIMSMEETKLDYLRWKFYSQQQLFFRFLIWISPRGRISLGLDLVISPSRAEGDAGGIVWKSLVRRNWQSF